MKTSFKSLACCGAVLVLGSTTQAQTINGWGNDSGEVSGTTIVDSGSGGNFNVSGTPSGNADFRADLPTVASLATGTTLTLSGTVSWATSGSMGGGVFRIGLIDFGSLGTLTGTSWSVGPMATGYWWGIPTGGAGVSNPGGGEITGKPASAGNAWLSGTGGYSVPGTGNNNSANMVPNTYNFSLSLDNTGSGISISYLMTDTANGGSYSESGTVNDTTETVPLNFYAVGFFANGSDTAFGAPGGVSFGNVTETLVTAPEPSSMALLGIGTAVGTFVARRRNRSV